jgi:pimeloyl-ACP methyl ester carboxylesterase
MVNKDYPPLAKGSAPYEEIQLGPIHGYTSREPFSPVVIVYLHGNAESLVSDIPLFDLFFKLRYSFVAIDYPGYGHSMGTPSEETLRNAAIAAIQFAKDNFPGQKVVLWGRSLGAAVALQGYDIQVDKLILLSGWTTFEEAAKNISPLGRLIPKKFLDNNRYDSLAKMKKVTSPTLIIHGSKDEVIPFSHGVALSLATDAEVHFLRLEGAGHNDVFGRNELWSEIFHFISE